MLGGPLRALSLRLKPNDDLVSCLLATVKTWNVSSAFILTAVGSLSRVKIRLASAQCLNEDGNGPLYINDVVCLEEKMEITSLVGTMTPDSKKHLHITVGKSDGSVIGGHLVEGTVFTTCEIVIGSIHGVTFSREKDPDTGYEELVIEKA